MLVDVLSLGTPRTIVGPHRGPQWLIPCCRRRVTLSAVTSMSLIKQWARDPSISSWFPASLRMLSSCMRCQVILHFIVVFRHSLASSPSTKEVKGYRIEYSTRLRLSSGSMTSAIMDTIGSKRATLFGHSEGCPMSVLFAATCPERVSHLILFGGTRWRLCCRMIWTEELRSA
jgi:pimeloyl-ACP methyl ester carboxylesterase